MSEPLKIDSPDTCPKCNGETTFGYGLAGGGTLDEHGDVVPGAYVMCLDCDWMGPMPQKTICFPQGLVREPSGA